MLSKGFTMRHKNDLLTTSLTSELRRIVGQYYAKTNPVQFENSLKDRVVDIVFEQLGRCPVVVPVISEV